MDLSFYGAKVTFKIIVDPPPPPKNFFFGGGVKIFFIAFLAELGNLESFETMLFFQKFFPLQAALPSAAVFRRQQKNILNSVVGTPVI